jgi:DNA-binding YbaB/EbfC family protein
MFGDIGKMLKMVGEMKRRMPEMQAKLAASEYTADSGDGTVHATVNGKLALVAIKIAPAAAANVELLQQQIVEAVAAAQTQAAEAAADAMKELTGGIDLPPGLGF